MASTAVPSPERPSERLIDLSGRIAIVTGGAMGIGLDVVVRTKRAPTMLSPTSTARPPSRPAHAAAPVGADQTALG